MLNVSRRWLKDSKRKAVFAASSKSITGEKPEKVAISESFVSISHVNTFVGTLSFSE